MKLILEVFRKTQVGGIVVVVHQLDNHGLDTFDGTLLLIIKEFETNPLEIYLKVILLVLIDISINYNFAQIHLRMSNSIPFQRLVDSHDTSVANHVFDE